MNFLAHLYLSGDNKELMIGNFIADHVKGKDGLNYPEEIKKGIELHKQIDFFTDNHSIVEISKARIRSTQHKYSPVVVDIFYDHFLAANWKRYSELSLETFAENFFKTIILFEKYIPERTKKMLPYMQQQNWLVKYASLAGLQKVLTGMSNRASFENKMHTALEDLEKNYSLFEKEFFEFFNELEQFVHHQLK
jgi:acyl carrier protein phosphodiesterase